MMNEQMASTPRTKRDYGLARQIILDATETVLATKGANQVSPKEICRDLGLPSSLVNYHFGGRESLLAEAAVVAYEKYCALNAQAVANAGPNAENRVRAWIWSQYNWTVANPGTAALLNYSMGAPDIGELFQTRFQHRMEVAARINLVAIGGAVRDLATGQLQPEPINEKALEDESFLVHMALVSWVTLGVSTWISGQHSPTRNVQQLVDQRHLLNKVIDSIVATIIHQCQ